MLDLILPNTLGIIKETMKRENGGDGRIVLTERTKDYEIYVNDDTCSKYLVQCSNKYDLFGFQNYKETFPIVDTYIYLGIRFIFIHLAYQLVNDFKTSGKWDKRTRDGEVDAEQWWTPSFILFNRIGGIIYDFQDWALVDRMIG
jgi:hypothetical protein